MTKRPLPFRTDDAARTSQLALVALCVLALLAAAMALPPVTGVPPAGESVSGEGDGSGSGSGGGNDGSGDGGGGDSIGIEPPNGTGTPLGDLEPPNGTLDRACAVYLLERPVPGAVVPVLVLRNGTPDAGVTVRFNGRVVGETDDRGIVAGEVPYRRELAVSVDAPGDVDCVFVDHDGEVRQSPLAAGFLAQTLAARQADGSDRGRYPVDGTVRIGVRGDPYPGDRVDVLAAIDGVPMAHAAVTIDGEQVGATDATGRATVRVPDDGRETVTVGVRRGDFAGTRALGLLVLRVGVVPQAPLALPGTRAIARATIGGEPVPDARVTLAGDAVGRTDADGRVAFSLPADPSATLVVDGRDQRASTTLWPAYLPTIGVGCLYLGALAVAYRRDGASGLAGLLAATGLLSGIVVLVYGLVRGDATLAAAGAVGTGAGAGVLFWQRDHWRAASRAGADDLGRLVTRLAAAVARFAYGAALALERFVVWAGSRLAGLIERVRSTPRSGRGLTAALAAWLAGFPGRVLALARWIRRGPRLLVAWWRARGGTEQTEASPPSATPSASEAVEDGAFSLREAWRRFARRVAPGPWRRRTPGEVARAAVSEGFPRESVGEFTDVFRDVEYGERPLTRERRERAEAAFETLSGHRPDEDPHETRSGHRRDEEAGD